MYTDAQMVAAIPPDVRVHIPGDPDSIALRKLAWLLVNDCGLEATPVAIDTAIDAWIAIGAPQPELLSMCPYCNTAGLSQADSAGHWACADCDIIFGDTWGTGHSFKLLCEVFPADVLAGNLPTATRTARWPDNTNPSDYLVTSMLSADQLAGV
jgi:hypothetical protein